MLLLICYYCVSRRRGHVGVWQDKIYPGMKKAVLGALLCSQDIVEYRKVCISNQILMKTYLLWI